MSLTAQPQLVLKCQRKSAFGLVVSFFISQLSLFFTTASNFNPHKEKKSSFIFTLVDVSTADRG